MNALRKLSRFDVRWSIMAAIAGEIVFLVISAAAAVLWVVVRVRRRPAYSGSWRDSRRAGRKPDPIGDGGASCHSGAVESR
jgi:hypothetical protein